MLWDFDRVCQSIHGFKSIFCISKHDKEIDRLIIKSMQGELWRDDLPIMMQNEANINEMHSQKNRKIIIIIIIIWLLEKQSEW